MTEQDRYVAEKIRPLMERMRNMYYEALAAKLEWTAGMNAQIPNDATVYDDRASEGTAGVSGAVLYAELAELASFISQMETAGVLDTVQAACVRAVRID